MPDADPASEPDADPEVEHASVPVPVPAPAPSSSSDSEADANRPGLRFGFDAGGEYQLRGNAMSDIPLPTIPPSADVDRTSPPGELGQNYFAEQWVRLRARVGLVDHPGGSERVAPFLSLVGEADLLYGVAFGDLAQGTRPAAMPRDQPGYPGIRLRHLYLDWRSPIGVFRLGQMGFRWGLGIVANDGETPPVFGDYRFGDLVRRLLFATRPLGESSPLTVAISGDWVAWDLLADFERPCPSGQGSCGDVAFQGVLAAFWEEGDDMVGGYVAYRTQKNYLDDFLDVFAADLYARFHVDEPSGGRILLAAEAAFFQGQTSITRTPTRPQTEVQQFLVAAQAGRISSDLDVILEGGYATGDSNTEDGVERRATFDPDHRVGLVLFPEVIAWQTARAAWLAQSPDTFGRPARGAELIPTNGGVSGAFYLFPHAMFRPTEWLDVRIGSVLGWSSTDIVDPYRQRAEGRSVNYRGGDPTRRDLGVELDASVRFKISLSSLVRLELGLEGGVLFPGAAFDDANGTRMGEVGLARLRGGLVF
ncbi:MAG: hypothetical protein OHK0013_49130 [Sandaracinaceae bacterium]